MTLARPVLASVPAAVTAALLILLAGSAAPRPADAATIDVACNTTALIQAIEAANNETTNPGPDTLELAAGCTYTLTTADSSGANGLPRITTTVTINGHGSTIARDGAAPQFRIIEVSGTGTLTLNTTTLTGGHAPDGTSGVAGQNGGAVLVAGTATIVDSTVADSQAGDGYGSAGEAGTDGGWGGGIFLSGAGSLTILNSTIEGNRAGHGGLSDGFPDGVGGRGGAILLLSGSGIVSNSTVAGNAAGNSLDGGAGHGGGVATTAGIVAITNSTIVGNSAGASMSGPGLGGGILLGTAGSTTRNTLVANSPASANCAGYSSAAGSINNLSSDGACGASFTQKTLEEINLGPLASNGGPTQTMAVVFPSAAIDAGDAATCAASPVNNLDQRGSARPTDGDNNGSAICDVGAYEAGGVQTGPVYQVNSTAGDNDGVCHTAPDCTLREAITAANADGVPSTVVLGNAQTYTLTVADNANNGLPVISTPITVNGNGSTIARDPAAPRFRIFDVIATGSLALDHLTLTGGNPPNKTALSDADGAGIQVNSASLTLNAVTVSGNTSGTGRSTASAGTVGGHGGGIYLAGSATAEVTDSTISGNAAGGGGGGNTNSGGAGGSGGGVYVTGTASLTLSRSTVSGNNAGDGGPSPVATGGTGGGGGGILVSSTASASIVNSTITENTAGDGGETDGSPTGVRGSGGGLRSLSGNVYLANDTIAGNARGSIGGTAGTGGNISTTVAIAAANTLVANPAVGENCAATFTGSTNNMASDATCGASFAVRTSAQINLLPLANNSGPTDTMALGLSPTSAAVDAGDNTTCAAAPVNNLDQRGVPRPTDGDGNSSMVCDIGAYEAPGWQLDPVLVVNSTADDNDGACQFLPGDCTLREAVASANATAGLTTINFDIPPGGPRTILMSNGVTLLQPATIDGTTQPGFAGTPIIELVGRYVPPGFTTLGAVHILSSNSLVRGLVVRNVPANGIAIGDLSFAGGSGNRIEGNFIGTDATGTIASPNGGNGVFVLAAGPNYVGGATPPQRNVISGNVQAGVFIGNDGGNTVEGNYIGTTASGNAPLGNLSTGVFVSDNNAVIGGTDPGQANVIAFNSGDGVRVATGTANTIRGNLVYSNGLLGIDNITGGNGEPGHAPPVVTAVGSASGTVANCPGCVIDVYSDAAGQGRTWNGSVIADGAGNWTYFGPVSGPNVTATATDNLGSTSEFSSPLPCGDSDGDTVNNCTDADDDNDGFDDDAEFGIALCKNGVNDDSSDGETTYFVNDGCPAIGSPETNCGGNLDNDADGYPNDGCPKDGLFSEADFKIGTGSLDPCGDTGWPADLFGGALSTNKLTIQDISSFVAPTRRLDKSPGDANFSSRWDLLPGRGLLAKFINIQDITALVPSNLGSTARPPMFNGAPAFGQTCPYPP